MEQATDAPLKKTPLNARHRASGARMVAFGGWDMPVEYSGIVAEHMAVRERAGLFDVSHMGEIEIAGKNALDAVQRISCNDASKLAGGAGALLRPDDARPARSSTTSSSTGLPRQHFLLVVNASHIAHGLRAHRRAHQVRRATRWRSTPARVTRCIAVQGPRALDVLQPLTGVELGAMKYYWFAHGEVAGVRATISRTGYTGEDGFEIFVPPQSADRVWLALLEVGRPSASSRAASARATRFGSKRPCACTATTSTRRRPRSRPISAGWSAGTKATSSARRSCGSRRRAGVARKLVGFEMLERGIARQGYDVYAGDRAGRPRDERHADAVSEEGHRAWPTCQSNTRPPAPSSTSTSAAAGRAPRVVPMPFYKRKK